MSKVIFANLGHDEDVHFQTREDAERWLREQGYEDTGEEADEVYEGFSGTIYFWTEEGRDIDSYPDGYEPRLYIGEATDED